MKTRLTKRQAIRRFTIAPKMARVITNYVEGKANFDNMKYEASTYEYAVELLGGNQ